MRKFVFLSLLLSTLSAFAEPIFNVRAQQEGKKIVLLYDLSTNQHVSQVNILINNRHRVIPGECLTGDIFKVVQMGRDRRIEYDVLADYTDGLQDEVEFMIFTADYFSDTPKPETPTLDNSQTSITQSHKPAIAHHAVDMGLSVKWAAYNVGADSPLAVGDYFAWGEIVSKTIYSPTNYDTDYFEDAAAAQWGGEWRVPTVSEWNELKDNCIWKWGTLDGVSGYKVTSQKNGNSIFLPAAGWKENYSINNQNYQGYYWLTLLNPKDSNQARCIYLDANKVGVVNQQRSTGRSLRAVCP